MNIVPFWLCYVEGTHIGFPYKHFTLEAAETEAERLAQLPDNRGKQVYVLGVISSCEVPKMPVTWSILNNTPSNTPSFTPPSSKVRCF